MQHNLKSGQYQIGEFVFGRDTMFPVESFDSVGGYDVNVQDSQAFLSDELRFGSDSLKPMPIQIKMHARNNYTLPNIAALTNDMRPLNYDHDRKVGEFVAEWRADDVRFNWGALKSIYICRDDGRVVRMYGRPGKISVSRLPKNGQSRDIVAEFRRSDTLVYSDFEWFMNIQGDEIVTVVRSNDLDMGNAASWMRFLLIGPMDHPIIQVGPLTIELDASLAINDVVEISSYPWDRRVIRANDGYSLGASLVSPYLDKLKFEPESPLEVSWTATNINTSVDQVDFSAYNSNDWYGPDYFGGNAGTAVVSGGSLHWSASGNDARTAILVRKLPTISNYQLVGLTIQNPAEDPGIFGGDAVNRIIGRCNASRTEYLYWDITFNNVWFGAHVNGQDFQMSEAMPIQGCLATLGRVLGSTFHNIFGFLGVPDENWLYEAEFGNSVNEISNEYRSTLRVNGHTFAAVAFGDNEIPIALSETGNRLTGVGLGAMSKGVLGQSIPGNVTEFHMRDNPPPDVAATLNSSAVIMLWRDSWHVP